MLYYRNYRFPYNIVYKDILFGYLYMQKSLNMLHLYCKNYILTYNIMYKDVLFIHEGRRQNFNPNQCETLTLALMYTK